MRLIPPVAKISPTITTSGMHQGIPGEADKWGRRRRGPRVVAAEKIIWRATSSPARCHIRPYRPQARLLNSVTIATNSTNSVKCHPYAVGVT